MRKTGLTLLVILSVSLFHAMMSGTVGYGRTINEAHFDHGWWSYFPLCAPPPGGGSGLLMLLAVLPIFVGSLLYRRKMQHS